MQWTCKLKVKTSIYILGVSDISKNGNSKHVATLLILTIFNECKKFQQCKILISTEHFIISPTTFTIIPFILYLSERTDFLSL